MLCRNDLCRIETARCACNVSVNGGAIEAIARVDVDVGTVDGSAVAIAIGAVGYTVIEMNPHDLSIAAIAY